MPLREPASGGAGDGALPPERHEPPEAWTALATPRCAPLLEALAGIATAPAPATIQRLRRTHDAAEVAAAVELSMARTRARAKFGEAAATLWADRRGVEMASGPRVAAWKARRFAAAGAGDARPVADLCCGIGGDLMALSRVAAAHGVDRDPLRAWMAACNSGARTRCADAVAQPCEATFAHADPARRVEDGRRLLRSDELLPTLAQVRAATQRCAGVAVKLGPGMDLAPEELRAGDELEFISEDGVLVQQVQWSGVLAGASARTATRACCGLTVSGTASVVPVASHPGVFARALFVPDPALERARLLGAVAARHALAEPAAGLGILTGEATAQQLGADAAWFERFEVVEVLPAREATVAAWLAQRDAGIVTVRTRGGACDPDAWQRALRGRGATPWTVFVLRLGDARRAVVVRE
ncbi:MAG: hypothetical protein U0625_13555 [Phycisphaerales bacterium]